MTWAEPITITDRSSGAVLAVHNPIPNGAITMSVGEPEEDGDFDDFDENDFDDDFDDDFEEEIEDEEFENLDPFKLDE